MGVRLGVATDEGEDVKDVDPVIEGDRPTARVIAAVPDADAEPDGVWVLTDEVLLDGVLVFEPVAVAEGVLEGEGDTASGAKPTPAYIVLGHAFRNATPNPDVPTSVESYNTM